MINYNINYLLVLFALVCLSFRDANLHSIENNEEDKVIKELESKDVKVRRSAAFYFYFTYRNVVDEKNLPINAIPALLNALKDSDPEVRQIVANAFGTIGKASKLAIPALADLLSNDKEVKVRRSAAVALLGLGQLSISELPALRKAMKDSDKIVRITANVTTMQLGDDFETGVKFLRQFSTDSDEEVQKEALILFANLGVRAILFLKDGLKDKDASVRSWTVGAITWSINTPTERSKLQMDEIGLLINAINDHDLGVALAAIYSVSLIGERAKDAIPSILKHFKDPDWQIRAFAIAHVSAFGPASESAIPALKEALNDKHERVRIGAERTLSTIEKAKDKKHNKDK